MWARGSGATGWWAPTPTSTLRWDPSTRAFGRMSRTACRFTACTGTAARTRASSRGAHCSRSGSGVGMAEGVNFDLVADHRTVSGYVVGINAGWWDRLRLTLGMERRDVGIYSPLLTDGGNQLRERTVFIVQLGGALDERWR